MIHSGNWQRIERLPEKPGVVVYTSTGYWRDGTFYPAHRARPAQVEQPRRPIWRAIANYFGGVAE